MIYIFPEEYFYSVEERRDLDLEMNFTDEIQKFRTSIDKTIEKEIDEEYVMNNINQSRYHTRN